MVRRFIYQIFFLSSVFCFAEATAATMQDYYFAQEAVRIAMHAVEETNENTILVEYQRKEDQILITYREGLLICERNRRVLSVDAYFECVEGYGAEYENAQQENLDSMSSAYTEAMTLQANYDDAVAHLNEVHDDLVQQGLLPP